MGVLISHGQLLNDSSNRLKVRSVVCQFLSVLLGQTVILEALPFAKQLLHVLVEIIACLRSMVVIIRLPHRGHEDNGQLTLEFSLSRARRSIWPVVVQ